jgi:hypothetical protein
MKKILKSEAIKIISGYSRSSFCFDGFLDRVVYIYCAGVAASLAATIITVSTYTTYRSFKSNTNTINEAIHGAVNVSLGCVLSVVWPITFVCCLAEGKKQIVKRLKNT